MNHSFKAQVKQILEQIHIHADAMESKAYTQASELSRDMAIGIELATHYTDLLGEISDFVEEGGLTDEH